MKPGYKFQEGDHRAGLDFFSDENIKRTNEFLQKIKPIAEAKGNVPLSQLVLQWTVKQPGITIALVGARNKEQAITNAKALDISLTDDEEDTINRQLSFLELQEQE